jgi:hypothetical protein
MDDSGAVPMKSIGLEDQYPKLVAGNLKDSPLTTRDAKLDMGVSLPSASVMDRSTGDRPHEHVLKTRMDVID